MYEYEYDYVLRGVRSPKAIINIQLQLRRHLTHGTRPVTVLTGILIRNRQASGTNRSARAERARRPAAINLPITNVRAVNVTSSKHSYRPTLPAQERSSDSKAHSMNNTMNAEVEPENSGFTRPLLMPSCEMSPYTNATDPGTRECVQGVDTRECFREVDVLCGRGPVSFNHCKYHFESLN
jgi:hypothetical protein